MARLRSYTFAVAAVAAGFLIRWLLTPVLGTELPFITLFFAVFFAAWVGGLGPALVATLLSAVLALYAFIPPIYELDLTNPIAQIGTLFFVITGASVGLLGRARRRAVRLAAESLGAANAATAEAQAERARAEAEAPRAEEAAADAEEARPHAESILTSIAAGVRVLSREWTLRYMKPAAVKMRGAEVAAPGKDPPA